MFDDQQKRLLANLDEAHEAYYRAATFAGPSLHFHLRALEAVQANDFEQAVEYVYATLTSWGMHRMGSGGSKMREFCEFRESLRIVWPVVLQLQDKTSTSLDDRDWRNLRTAFCGIRCMASGTSLVGNSKVMAHLLPNLIPPIDREYTLKFLFRHGRIANGVELEWKKLEQILNGFFYPIAQLPLFQQKAKEWLTQRDRFKWDTSALKITDNLVIGLSKMIRREKESLVDALEATRA
jgi:hypothetical protein